MFFNPATQCRVINCIAPISASTTQTQAAGVNTAGFKTALVILLLGTMAGGATVDAKVQGSATLGGSYVNITGASFAQKVAATHAGLLSVGELDLRGSNASANQFLKCVATCATAASLVSMTIVLCNPISETFVTKTQPASEAAAAPLVAGTAATGYEFSIAL